MSSSVDSYPDSDRFDRYRDRDRLVNMVLIDDFVFADENDKPYYCHRWGNDLWLFYWHTEQHWVSLRPINEAEAKQLLQTYHDLHSQWESQTQTGVSEMKEEERALFGGEGWAKEDLPAGRYKITVPRTHVAMIARTGQLLVKTGLAFEAGDIIRVGEVEALVKEREAAWDYPWHNWLLTVDCEQQDELRKMLIIEFPRNLSSDEQQQYHILHAQWEAKRKIPFISKVNIEEA